MPSIREWIAIAAIVAFVLIPVCWKFWKGWDRPSRAAKTEMGRRKRERDMRDAFMLEDAKAREHERLQAERELARRRGQPPPTLEKGVLSSAFGSLDSTESTDSTGTEVLEESEEIRRDTPAFSTEDVTSLVDGLDVEDEPDEGHDEGHEENSIEEDVEWLTPNPKDDWPGIGW